MAARMAAAVTAVVVTVAIMALRATVVAVTAVAPMAVVDMAVAAACMAQAHMAAAVCMVAVQCMEDQVQALCTAAAMVEGTAVAMVEVPCRPTDLGMVVVWEVAMARAWAWGV